MLPIRLFTYIQAMKKLLSSFFCSTLILAFAATTPTAFAQKADRPNWVVGDKWEYKTLQRNDGNRVGAYQHEIEKISDGKIFVRRSSKNSEGVMVPRELITFNADMNYVTRSTPGVTSTPDAQLLNWPLESNKKYPAEFSWVNSVNAQKGNNDYKVQVSGPEELTVEAGTFQVYKVTAKGFWNNKLPDFTASGQSTQTIWYAPEIKRWVKWELQDRSARNTLNNDTVDELIKFTPGK